MELADGTVVFREAPVTNAYAASYLRADYPEIEATARAGSFIDDVPVAAGDRAIRLTAVGVDPEFLDIFDLPFVAGDARRALREPRSVVLTQRTAERLFGADSPLGKTVSLANLVDATVTGVVGTIPEPSHLGASVTALGHFDMLASMDLRDRYLQRGAGGPENWFGMDSTTYVLFPTDGSLKPDQLARDLDAFVHRHMPADQVAFTSLLLNLIPVGDVLGLNASALFLGGDRSATALLWMLGLLVLAVACINYASLAAARASRRMHEVGVRKAIGASASDILVQHLLEAGLLTVAALALAFVAVRALAPVLQTTAGIDLDLALSFEPRSVLFFATLAIAVTLLAGRLSGVRARAHPADVRAARDPAAHGPQAAVVAARRPSVRGRERAADGRHRGLSAESGAAANRPRDRRRPAARHRKSHRHHPCRARHAARRAVAAVPGQSGHGHAPPALRRHRRRGARTFSGRRCGPETDRSLFRFL
jgi:putative ABC transport system permease protein